MLFLDRSPFYAGGQMKVAEAAAAAALLHPLLQTILLNSLCQSYQQALPLIKYMQTSAQIEDH